MTTDQLNERLREASEATVRYWDEAPNTSLAPVKIRTAMDGLASGITSSDARLLSSAERLVRAAMPSVKLERDWTTEPLRDLIRYLQSLTRQLRRSPIAQDILQLCDDLRRHPSAVEDLNKDQQNELLSALMVVEDAICAVEGYRALPPFDHVDEAYLAKFGLMQALQLGFDAAQSVGNVLGVRQRADKTKEGKNIKVTRTIVAGHPLGGNMLGQAWQHYHDRGSAHEKSVMKIMSFSRRDSSEWTGQTQSTDQIMNDGLIVIRDLLKGVVAQLNADDPPSHASP